MTRPGAELGGMLLPYAFFVGDRVEFIGAGCDGRKYVPGTYGIISGFDRTQPQTIALVQFLGHGPAYAFPLTSLLPAPLEPAADISIPAPLPPTEDVLSLLLAEVRRTNELLAQLLPPRPYAPSASDVSAEDPVNYSGRQEALLRRYRPQGPQGEG